MADTKKDDSSFSEEQFKQLKAKAQELSGRLADLFPNIRKVNNPAAKAAIKNLASALKLKRHSQETLQRLQEANGDAQAAINSEVKHQHEESLAAEAKANEEAKREEQAVNNPQDVSGNELIKLAQKEPVNGSNNPWRPSWTHYNPDLGKWQLDANSLADQIAANENVRRVEEKGKSSGFVRYNPARGQWETIAPEDLGNFVDDYFKKPAYYSAKAHYRNDPNDKYTVANIQQWKDKYPQYAEDLHTAKAVRDTLTLLSSKIKKIVPAQTFDQPPKYLVHCRTFDFDVYQWKKVPFSPDHYFVSGLALDPSMLDVDFFGSPDSVIFTAKSESDKKLASQALKKLAPTTRKWLYRSLGRDETTFKAFLERLGLSMTHTYGDFGFIVFVKSRGGIGKSMLFNHLGSLFQYSDVTALDLDTMAKNGSFDAQELRQCDINLTSEVKVKYLSDVAINALKNLTGNDLRAYPQKFRGTADFTNHDHLWFNMNHLPRFDTYDDAVARRMDIFKWQKIENYDQVIGAKGEEKMKQERPELILLAMIYAHKCLHRNKHDYHYFSAPTRLTRSDSMIQNYEDWAQANDLFANFIKEKCLLDPECKIGVGFLLKSFNDFVQNEMGENIHFHANELKERLEGINIYRGKTRTSFSEGYGKTAKGVFVYQGITLKSIADVDDEAAHFSEEQEQAGRFRTQQMYERDRQRQAKMNK